MPIPAEALAKLSALPGQSGEAAREGGQAFGRLLSLAESSDCGQARRVAGFMASTYNGRVFPFELSELRAVDVRISDDMLACLDALRWGQAERFTLIPVDARHVCLITDRWVIRRAIGG